MTVARFMELALYHPEHGYYTAGPERTGWRGHFLTSPEVDPVFGELWARGFEEVWAMCGRPRRFDVIEVGPGEGGFAAAVLTAARGDFASSLSFVLVEPSHALRTRQESRLAGFERATWAPSLDRVTPVGCVFANEVLDNLPVHLVEGRGSDVMEVVIEAGPGGLQPILVRAPAELRAWLDRHGIAVDNGRRVEVGLAAESFAAAAAAAIGRGAVIFCDYGWTAGEAALRPAGTLVCYSESGVDDEWWERPGRKDITSHVNWTAVSVALRSAGAAPAPVLSQRAALKRLGLDALHDELRARSPGGVEAVRALSRRQALGVLADPGGLGGLGVLAATKNIESPRWLAGK